MSQTVQQTASPAAPTQGGGAASTAAPSATPGAAPSSVTQPQSGSSQQQQKDSKTTVEPELAFDTSSSKTGNGLWGPGGGMPPMGALGAIFAAGPLLEAAMSGDFQGASAAPWAPPSDPDFKHRVSSNKPSGMAGPALGPQRPGSRRYNEMYGHGDDDGKSAPYDVRRMGPVPVNGGGGVPVPAGVVHPQMAWRDVHGMAFGGDSDGDGDGDSGSGDDGEGEDGQAYHRNEQHVAMVAAYGNVRGQSASDKAALWDQLHNARDIRELNIDLIRSILLNGNRKFAVEDYEDAIHCLLAIVDDTLDHLNPIPPPAQLQHAQHQQPQTQPQQQQPTRPAAAPMQPPPPQQQPMTQQPPSNQSQPQATQQSQQPQQQPPQPPKQGTSQQMVTSSMRAPTNSTNVPNGGNMRGNAMAGGAAGGMIGGYPGRPRR